MPTSEMRRTWLVQRLNPPRSFGPLGVDNPFAFGGGLRNGGLSNEAMGLLRGIFGFDYMGSAEFEFGAVPEALQGLAKDHRRLTAWEFDIDGTPVYAVARKAHAAEVEERVRAMAAKDYQFKEATFLPAVLRPDQARYVPDARGWLELDNGFAFFVDREMWAQFCDLLDAKRQAVS